MTMGLIGLASLYVNREKLYYIDESRIIREWVFAPQLVETGTAARERRAIISSRTAAIGCLSHNVYRDAHAFVNWVVHVISTIDVHHVNVVRVAPADWPGIDKPKRVTTILEAPMLVVSSAYVKSVLGPKTSGVMSVGNASVRVIASVSTCRPRLRRPRLGPSRVVLLRVSHGMLLRLGARLSLLLRGMLFSRLGLLGVFGLRLRF